MSFNERGKTDDGEAGPKEQKESVLGLDALVRDYGTLRTMQRVIFHIEAPPSHLPHPTHIPIGIFDCSEVAVSFLRGLNGIAGYAIFKNQFDAFRYLWKK